MQLPNYTSQNIARALGLSGFENDESLAGAQSALRLLLLPSFHSELCLSFVTNNNRHTLTVIAAREQIWHQVWPSPKPAETSTATGDVSDDQIQSLVSALRQAESAPNLRVVVLDGLKAHTVFRIGTRREVDLNENVDQRNEYAAFVAAAVTLAWETLDHPEVRNSLRSAGVYVGLSFPEQTVPPAKPTVRTVILGPQEVASQLLASLKRKHEG